MRIHLPLAKCARLLAVVALAGLGLLAPLADASLRPALAQDAEDVDFRAGLEPYGRFIDHPRWGAVWVPESMADDWRPYRSGHWVYTDEWGWYWVADEEFGWITYHYGRWVRDRELGWIWVQGRDWSPAWVRWRRGDEAVGWAPMPPDDIVDEVEPDPDVWFFVEPRYMVAPSLAVYIMPRDRAVFFVTRTIVVSQTIVVRDQRRVVVANPGISPAFIAAKVGRPLVTVAVQPRVLRGTTGVTGAVVGTPARGVAMREVIKPQAKVIQPAKTITAPVAFKPGQPITTGPGTPAALRRVTTTTPSTTDPGTPKGSRRKPTSSTPTATTSPTSTTPRHDTTTSSRDTSSPRHDTTKSRDTTRSRDTTPRHDTTKSSRDTTTPRHDTTKSRDTTPKREHTTPRHEPVASRDTTPRRDTTVKPVTPVKPVVTAPVVTAPVAPKPPPPVVAAPTVRAAPAAPAAKPATAAKKCKVEDGKQVCK